MTGAQKTTNSTRTSLLKLLGFLTILAAGAAVFVAYAKYEAASRWQRAVETVGADAGERTAWLQEWLLRVDRTLSWFRAEDVSAVDRLAVTVRMLYNERYVAPAKALFLVSATGRLVAGTLPLPNGPTGAAAPQWFRSIQASPPRLGLQLTGCTNDPFGSDEGVVLYRAVLDHGAVAGYVGSFLPQGAIAAMVGSDAPVNSGTTLALRTASGEALGCRPADPPAAREQRPHDLRGWFSHLIHAWPRIGQRSAISVDRQIEPGGLRLVASVDALDSMSDDDWTALTYRAGYVVASLLLIMALASSMLRRLGRTARPRLPLRAANAALEAADWMWELDEFGNLVGLAGNAPDHLLPPSGRPLAELAGPIDRNDLRWDRLNAAISARHAFEGLQVPFQIPGRTGLLTIFALSGQPVLASGGFWGTASLVSEESVAHSRGSSLAKAQLSAA